MVEMKEHFTIALYDRAAAYNYGLNLWLTEQFPTLPKHFFNTNDSQEIFDLCLEKNLDFLIYGVRSSRSPEYQKLLEILKEFSTNQSKTKVLVLAEYVDEAMIAEVLNLGALGFLDKVFEKEVFTYAVESLLACHEFVWLNQ